MGSRRRPSHWFTRLAVGISSLLLGALVILRWPVEPTRLRAAPLLSFDQGGSIALEVGLSDAVELSLPSQMAYFPSASEAASVGAGISVDAEDIAAHLQAQLRAAFPGDPALEQARVRAIRTPEGASALEFISGPVDEGLRWRFVCPGQALGLGPAPPTRRAAGGRALCPSKYASPLVAALGAHPSLEGVEAEASRRASWPLGWFLSALCGLGVVAAGASALRRRPSREPVRGSRGA